MSAEGILENPAIFSGKMVDQFTLGLEYLSYAEKHNTHSKFIKGHMFRILDQHISAFKDLQYALYTCTSLPQYRDITLELQKRVQDPTHYKAPEEQKEDKTPVITKEKMDDIIQDICFI